jgi:hypothetical protein
MSDGTTEWSTGWLIRIVGWGTFVASVFFAFGNKSHEPPYEIPFFGCLILLAGTSVVYFVKRWMSESWQSATVRSYFSPFIVGSTIWILLLLLFAILDKFVG